MTDRATELREIAKTIAAACGKGVGYALFLVTGGEISYISNGHRPDVVKTLEEWLHKTGSATITFSGAGSGGRDFAKPKRESSREVDVRLELERRCAEIGKSIGQVTKLCLFLFNFGEAGTGNMAYFTNLPDARPGVASWIKSQRSVS